MIKESQYDRRQSVGANPLGSKARQPAKAKLGLPSSRLGIAEMSQEVQMMDLPAKNAEAKAPQA